MHLRVKKKQTVRQRIMRMIFILNVHIMCICKEKLSTLNSNDKRICIYNSFKLNWPTDYLFYLYDVWGLV